MVRYTQTERGSKLSVPLEEMTVHNTGIRSTFIDKCVGSFKVTR